MVSITELVRRMLSLRAGPIERRWSRRQRSSSSSSTLGGNRRHGASRGGGDSIKGCACKDRESLHQRWQGRQRAATLSNNVMLYCRGGNIDATMVDAEEKQVTGLACICLVCRSLQSTGMICRFQPSSRVAANPTGPVRPWHRPPASTSRSQGRLAYILLANTFRSKSFSTVRKDVP
jgi:hypothetical protein